MSTWAQSDLARENPLCPAKSLPKGSVQQKRSKPRQRGLINTNVYYYIGLSKVAHLLLIHNMMQTLLLIVWKRLA
jgi:hypothetical protein